MTRKNFFKKVLRFVLLAVLGYIFYYAWFSFPIISGFSAKNACSCVFIQGRSKEDINQKELGSFPLSLGSIEINYKDSSVTGRVLGLANRKAIYRKGFGCTLINGLGEANIRAQTFAFATPRYQTDSLTWPMGDQTDNGLLQKFDSAVSFVFNHRYNDKDVQTRAVVIVHKNQIVAERYGKGFGKNSQFLGWSMAKSITSALVGILVKAGKLQVHQPAPIKAWNQPDDKRRSITIEHLLQQRSGLDFRENYASYSNVTDMLFNQGDMAGFTATLPLKHEPGSFFYYSSGNSNLLSGIIRTTVGETAYHRFPYDSLFYKIGMLHTLLEPDASGTFVVSSYIHASARDYARFGLLYLNDGMWNGERILPQGWVQQTVTAPAINQHKNYGYQFWLNGLDENDPSKREFSEAPADLFYADGYGGQRIYIIPSYQLVIVRMGLNKFDEHTFLKKVMDAVK